MTKRKKAATGFPLKKIFIVSAILVILTGFMIPQKFTMPVEGADASSYHPRSFWYYPWGKSVTHKGVDIFAKEGTNILSSTTGIVVYKGKMGRGGNVVLVLGPKWRLHYYAHLKEFKTSRFSIALEKEIIGTVGTTGNAAGKSPHLHYSIITLFPYLWRLDFDTQGWKKIFFLNPIEYLKATKPSK